MTPPITVINNGALSGMVLNLANSAKNITVEIVTLSNVNEASLTQSVPPGQGFGQNRDATTGADFVYCRFTVDGSKSASRAGAYLFPPNGGVLYLPAG